MISMLDTIPIYFLFFLVYLVGSIPSGLIIGKIFFKKDLRKYGSQNIGATNAYRVLGVFPGLCVLFFDALKGALGVYLFSPNPLYMVIGGMLSMMGHNWSCFLGFKGGKGVATGLGVIIALVPHIVPFILGVFLIVLALSRYVSLSSILAAISVPICMYCYHEPAPIFYFGIGAAIFVIVRHRVNIERLLQGKELKLRRVDK